MYPSRRSDSNAPSDSASCARPVRSAIRVWRSSSMISLTLARPGGDREGARVTAEAAVAQPVLVGEVERDDRDALALDVLPDVELGPVEERMDADVRAALELGLVLVPHLRRLVGHVPFHLPVARAEVALLRAGAVLVAPDADDDARVPVLVEDRLQRVLLEPPAAGDPSRSSRPDTSARSARAASFFPTISLRFHSRQSRSRYSIMLGILNVVST